MQHEFHACKSERNLRRILKKFGTMSSQMRHVFVKLFIIIENDYGTNLLGLRRVFLLDF